jgi:hypothetical protein
MMAWRTDEAGHLANGPSDPFQVQGSQLTPMTPQVELPQSETNFSKLNARAGTILSSDKAYQ